MSGGPEERYLPQDCKNSKNLIEFPYRTCCSDNNGHSTEPLYIVIVLVICVVSGWGGGGVLSYLSYIGICGAKGYGS